MINTIIHADWIAGLQQIPDAAVNCCITSPPYYGLRDYGVDGQVGLEDSPEAFIEKLVTGFREVKRVLRDDGTLWVNIGDSYANYHGNNRADYRYAPSNKPGYFENQRKSTVSDSLKPKDLIGIPWMLAFALRADGWYLRQDIIWNKPNPMPESVTDRCTRAHEYIFMFSKSNRYYYDAYAIRTPYAEKTLSTFGTVPAGRGDDSGLIKSEEWHKRVPVRKPKEWKNIPDGQANIRSFRDKQRGHSRRHNGFNDRWDHMTTEEQQSMGANKRSVWTVSTKPFKEAHFATFPPELIVDMIKAGCPVDGTVLDPFMGAGTTALVARKLDRNFIGIELNEKYIAIAQERLTKELGMFV